MLLMKNRAQVVEASVPGLAKRAGVTVGECEEALRIFKEPDPYSRSREYEGRRIADWGDGRGWKVLNGEIYKHRMNAEELRMYKAEWAREYRKRRKRIKEEGGKGGAREAISDGLEELRGEIGVDLRGGGK